MKSVTWWHCWHACIWPLLKNCSVIRPSTLLLLLKGVTVICKRKSPDWFGVLIIWSTSPWLFRKAGYIGRGARKMFETVVEPCLRESLRTRTDWEQVLSNDLVEVFDWDLMSNSSPDLTVWPWGSYLTSLNLNPLICKLVMITESFSQNVWGDTYKGYNLLSNTE